MKMKSKIIRTETKGKQNQKVKQNKAKRKP
jgi:hypothetical protein